MKREREITNNREQAQRTMEAHRSLDRKDFDLDIAQAMVAKITKMTNLDF